jgi:type IV pilus assembly protein PilM
VIFKKKKSLVGLDIGASSVKAVELTNYGDRLYITGIGRKRIENPEYVSDTIRQTLDEAGIKARRVSSSVSGRSVIFRPITMMSMSNEELQQAIRYEADKYIPFDVNEVVLDCQALKDDTETPTGQMKVLLVAAKQTLVDDHIALIESAELIPHFIDVDVFALSNAFELRNLLMGVQDDEVRALVDVGAMRTNINIMRGNWSLFQREMYIAGDHITEALARRFGEDPADVEKMKVDPGGALESMQEAFLPVLEEIGSEVRLSFDFFESQHEMEVREVYVSGGTVQFPGIDIMLSQILNIEARLWDPTEGLELMGAGINPAGFIGANSEMAVAIGLASRIRSM